MECPNCGDKNYNGATHCGCTWAEMRQAATEKEIARRAIRPVAVDHQTPQ